MFDTKDNMFGWESIHTCGSLANQHLVTQETTINTKYIAPVYWKTSLCITHIGSPRMVPYDAFQWILSLNLKGANEGRITSYFHHRKQSHPGLGRSERVVSPQFLIILTDRGSLWSQKSYLSVSVPHSYWAWWENASLSVTSLSHGTLLHFGEV